MDNSAIEIPLVQRGMALMTHLSGLSGYIIPLGGVLVPIIIWYVNKESAIISSIAKQAILLNVVAFASIFVAIICIVSVILLPVGILLILVVGAAAIVLPIVGALKANAGTYFRYPVIGVTP